MQSPPARPGRRSFWQWYRAQTRFARIGLGCGSIFAVLMLCICSLAAYGSTLPPPPKTAQFPTSIPTKAPTQVIVLTTVPTTPPTPSPTATRVPTATPTMKPTPTPRPTSTPRSIHYPPTTLADLRGLAAKGDMSAIHAFHSESVGAVGVCPEPKLEVTVDPSVTGQQLAEDLLAYFYTQQIDSPCGSVVFAYHNQGEANDVYTAGRILFDVTDSSGQGNFDPNATNLKHTLTLDIGGFFTNQEEYVVTY